MPINLSADVVAGLVDAWFPCDCWCKLCNASCVLDDDSDVASSMKVLLETFLNNLPNCVSRELIDKVGTCYGFLLCLSLIYFLIFHQSFLFSVYQTSQCSHSKCEKMNCVLSHGEFIKSVCRNF